MKVSVTVLGSRASHRGAAASDVVAYLAGSANRLSAAGSLADAKPLLGQESGVGTYYSDSGHLLGRWRGEEAERLGATVDPAMLQRVLLGQDPHSGLQLVAATGSSGRAATPRVSLPDGAAVQLFTLDQAAAHLGVDARYLRRLATKTATYRTETTSPTTTASSRTTPMDSTLSPTAPSLAPKTLLDATKVDGRWMVTRAEIDRFAASRREPQVVIGYDVTFSAPKSLSILWATGTPAVKALCEEAFDAGVAAAMRYLEANAIWVRRGRGHETASGMLAASYRHETNRELEPQLHEHVVIANMATAADGRVQALDARGLFAHATTAGYLAEVEMQHVTNRKGIAWTATQRGIANVAGVSREAIRSVSTRQEQVLSVAAELGVHSRAARHKIALATRAGKDHGVDPNQLRDRWRNRLEKAGFGRQELRAATTAAPARLWTPDDTRRLDAHLSGSHGVTEQRAIFDRRDVIQAIVNDCDGRLAADEVQTHADRWLGTDAAIALASSQRRGEVIGREGKVALAAGATYYTTPTMVALEHNIVTAWVNGFNTNTATVPDPLVSAAITSWEAATGHRLGTDQTAMVTSICRSGDRFQAVVGPAGTGKTAALEVAARAWESAGYQVIGAAVNGTAAQVLAKATGIDARTVASLVTRLDTATTPVLHPHTVVLIDEASTLGNRHFARLVHHIQHAGAAVRLVGDPAQHAAVEAGGMWAELVRRYPERTPHLTENRRQSAPEMSDVRLAAADYRAGRIADALARLDSNERIVTAPTSEELLDQLAADWYVDRAHTGRPSRMIAEHHAERRALNIRAQTLLRADDTLNGAGVRIGEATFHVGDEVIARAQNRALRPNAGGRDSYLRNGTLGTVTDIVGKPGHEDLIVNFADRGSIRVPHAWLTTEVRPGVTGGLAPAYAVTSHAAQGDTYRSGRMLTTDTSQTEAVYVGLTRGTNDTRLYTVKRDPPTIDTDPKLPRLDDERTAVEALTEQLTKPKAADLATAADPGLARVLQLTTRPLAELEGSADPLAARAASVVADRIANHAIHHPDPALIAEIGPRSTHPQPALWDNAARQHALHRERATTPQLNADTALRDSIITARAARLATMSPEDLIAQRRQLIAVLTNTTARDPGFARASLHRASQRYDNTLAIEQAARQEHDRASRPRARRRDPDCAEHARRALRMASDNVADARVDLKRAAAALAAAPQSFAERDVIIRELQAVNLALERRALTHLEPEKHEPLRLGL